MKRQRETPPPSIYTKDYYTSLCFGHREFAQGELASTFKRTLSYVRPKTGDRILDVGCGRGEIVKACGIAGAEAVGMDYSSDATMIAQGFVGQGRIFRASGTHLPFATNSFDCVIMLQFVEHLDETDMVSCLAEVRRVLRPKGRLLILTDNPWHDHYEAFRRLYRWLRYHESLKAPKTNEEMYHVNVRSPIYWTRLLKTSGFRRTRVWVYNRPIRRMVEAHRAAGVVLLHD